jgi:hypothetical protein
MKNLKLIALLVIPVLFSTACDNDDAPVNEEEVITTVRVTLVGGGQTITLESKDLDGGDGPNPPVLTPIGGATLVAGTTYTGTTTFLNELTNPVDNITEEVEEEGAEHQVFYQLQSTLGTITYNPTDVDANGKPIGLKFTLVAGSVGNGNLTVTLRHDLNKSAAGVASGNIANAGGSTDAAVSFPIVVN